LLLEICWFSENCLAFDVGVVVWLINNIQFAHPTGHFQMHAIGFLGELLNLAFK
jgi:hypothetical protein